MMLLGSLYIYGGVPPSIQSSLSLSPSLSLYLSMQRSGPFNPLDTTVSFATAAVAAGDPRTWSRIPRIV